ncbi:hypothetical protein E4V99_09480 [Microbacterium sp. dk485]|uniref:hypothetical protein n=1 Tax=Microbacterium sp. dk485 TaxID=2560021 RepID=UPI0010737EEA|nr:hypothetical protein [Microbacterium sp. dk485]TFV85222.1 hypothetical protein E4V99_09480 [Microbacterium sp. dk485]
MPVLTATRAAPARDPRAGAAPVAFTGSWPAVGAWGAGLVVAGLGAGAIAGPNGSGPSRAVGFVVFSLGLAWLAWGTAALSRGRIPAPRAVAGGAVAGMLLLTALLVLSPAHTSVFAVGTAMGLLLAVALCTAGALRRPHDERPARAMSVWGLVLAAAVLSVVVTPALTASRDAVLLREDGTVPVVTHDGH